MQTQSFRMRSGWLLVAMCLMWMMGPLHAATTQSVVNPPLRVARVSWLAGQASLLPAGSDQWQSVDVNRPMLGGDELATATGARVELQLGDAVAHVDGDTDFSFLALTQWRTQLALQRGTLALDVRQLPDGEHVEIDTPQVAVVIDRPAQVRVDVGDGTASTLTVRRGSVVVHGDDGAQRVLHAGERYRFASPVLADAVAQVIGSGDGFDAWCRSRHAWYAANADAPRRVADGTVGYRDLDHYGQWRREADYGAVWFPDDVASDWAPYRQGRWIWVAPWGWTWLSHEPWGFAPFHYGRWVTVGGRWGWLPGPVNVPAVYAPALVGFFGGDGWQVSLGVGSAPIGWYPLGPSMIYNPWYAANWRYYRHVNRCVTHYHRHHHHGSQHGQHRPPLRQAYNAWRKPELLRHVHYLKKPPAGVTVVSRQTLAKGHAVAAQRLHVPTRHWRKVPLLQRRGLDALQPSRHLAAWKPAHVSRTSDKPVVALHVPAPVHAVTRYRQKPASAKPRAPRVRQLTHVKGTSWHPAARTARTAAERVRKYAFPRPGTRVHRDDMHAPAIRLHPAPVKSRPAAPVRAKPVATLPSVPHLQVLNARQHRAKKPRPVLPGVARMRLAHPQPHTVHRPRFMPPAEPRHVAKPDIRHVSRHASPPVERHRVELHRRLPPSKATPRPRPHLRQTPKPVRWHAPRPTPRVAPRPVVSHRPTRVIRRAPVSRPRPVHHAAPRPAPRHATSRTSKSRNHRLPPPVRWKKH